jgi:hypothetical protein
MTRPTDRHRIPISDETVPIACTIAAHEVGERIALIERLRRHLARIERTPHGLLLHFAPEADIEADVRRFAVDEKRCCQFWGFAVAVTAEAVTLRWDGPPSAGALVASLHAWFRGDAPLSTVSELSGLLQGTPPGGRGRGPG